MLSLHAHRKQHKKSRDLSAAYDEEMDKFRKDPAVKSVPDSAHVVSCNKRSLTSHVRITTCSMSGSDAGHLDVVRPSKCVCVCVCPHHG